MVKNRPFLKGRHLPTRKLPKASQQQPTNHKEGNHHSKDMKVFMGGDLVWQTPKEKEQHNQLEVLAIVPGARIEKKLSDKELKQTDEGNQKKEVSQEANKSIEATDRPRKCGQEECSAEEQELRSLVRQLQARYYRTQIDQWRVYVPLFM